LGAAISCRRWRNLRSSDVKNQDQKIAGFASSYGLSWVKTLFEHEAFVMKPNALRPNVADLKGCRAFSIFMKNCYPNGLFT
jgi:hypothetical protein